MGVGRLLAVFPLFFSTGATGFAKAGFVLDVRSKFIGGLRVIWVWFIYVASPKCLVSPLICWVERTTSVGSALLPVVVCTKLHIIVYVRTGFNHWCFSLRCNLAGTAN